MLDFLKIIARAQLRALGDIRDGGNRREQETLFDREAEQLGLGMRGGKGRDDAARAIVLGHRFGAGRERLAEPDPVLVARRLIAVALLAEIAHQLGAEDAECGAEEKGTRDPSVLRGPDYLREQAARTHAARRAPILIRIERRRE